jgi:hypothetical protein
MAIQIQGNMGVIVDVDGTTYRAVKIVVRPADYGLLGQYRISMQSGTMAAGFSAFSAAFQARWIATPQLAVIWGVSIDGLAVSTTAFAAGRGFIGVQIVRGWTVDGSGGTLAVLTGNQQSLRSSMPPSLMGSIRIASTTGLGNGTATTDPQGEGATVFAVAAVTSTNFIGQYALYGNTSLEDGGNTAPIVLAQNEGINIEPSVPATGTWRFGVTMLWSEVNAY